MTQTIYFLFFFFSLPVYSEIGFIRTNRPAINNIAANAYSYDSTQETHLTFFMVDHFNSTLLHIILQFVANATSFSFNIYSTDVTSLTPINVQARTTEGNTISGQGVFLLFTTQKVTLYRNYFTSSITVLTTNITTRQVVEAFFVTNSTANTMAIIKAISLNYTLAFYTNSTKINEIVIPVLSTSRFIRKIKKFSYVFLLFNVGIYSFSMNSSITPLNQIIFSQNGTFYSLDVDGVLLTYSIDYKICVINISNMSSFVQRTLFTLPTLIDDIRIRYPFLIFISNNVVSQYDLDLNLTIHTFINTTTNMRFDILKSGIFYMYQDYPTIYSNTSTFRFNQLYASNGSLNCLQGYYQNLTSCFKNLSYIYSINNPNTSINNNTSVNITNNNTNIINKTNLITNNTNITPSTNTNTSLNWTTPSNIDTKSQEYKNQITVQNNSNFMVQFIGKSLTFSPIRILPNGIRCFALLLDDIWYYKFHRISYPQTAKFFMDKIDIINQFRLTPWFFQQINFLSQIKFGEEYRQIYNQQIDPHQNNPQSIYFFDNSNDILVSVLFMNLTFFFLCKILEILLFVLRNLSIYIRKLYVFVKINCKWWSFFPLILEANIPKLVFNSTIQILGFFSFNINNKLNLISSTMNLFISLLYCFLFYRLVYQFEKKKSAETILAHSHYRGRGFFLQSYCFFVRSFLRSMTHAIFLYVYQYQVIVLLLTDSAFCFSCIYYYRSFSSRALFITMLGYNLTFFSLDLFFYLHLKVPGSLDGLLLSYDQIVQYLIWILIGTLLLSVIIILGYTLYSTCFKSKQRDKESLIQVREYQKKIRSEFGFCEAKLRIKLKQTKKEDVRGQKQRNTDQSFNKRIKKIKKGKEKTKLSSQSKSKYNTFVDKKQMLEIMKGEDEVDKTPELLIPVEKIGNRKTQSK